MMIVKMHNSNRTKKHLFETDNFMFKSSGMEVFSVKLKKLFSKNKRF